MSKTDPGNFKVFCRVRPLDSQEKPNTETLSFRVNENAITISPTTENSSQSIFTFEQIFTPESTQEEVFEKSSKPIINNVLQGFNGTIIAYGQKNSGKTYTMTGSDIFDQDHMGIIPRTISTIFPKPKFETLLFISKIATRIIAYRCTMNHETIQLS